MKTLKLFIAFIVIVFFAQKTMAQAAVTGLYLTYDDYLNHKLSFETGGANGNSIELNNFLDGGKVIVWHDGKRQVFLKNEIFGYQSKNIDYRFFNNVDYKIIDTQYFYIYSHPQLMQQGKDAKPVDTYYFSALVNSAVEPLTIHDLEIAYAENPKFRYTIESQFQTDNELTKYDAVLKEYELKYLFAQSTK